MFMILDYNRALLFFGVLKLTLNHSTLCTINPTAVSMFMARYLCFLLIYWGVERSRVWTSFVTILDRNMNFTGSDPNLAVDILTYNLDYLSTTWDQLGQPTVTIILTNDMLDNGVIPQPITKYYLSILIKRLLVSLSHRLSVRLSVTLLFNWQLTKHLQIR